MSRWRSFYHAVWATRAREPLITATLEPVVHCVVRQIAQHHRITVHAIGGTEDHIHIAISIPPSLQGFELSCDQRRVEWKLRLTRGIRDRYVF
jgi:REP element-mobilizing transposase RayT